MDSFARYPSRSYTVMPDGLLVEMIGRKVGRNGWAVMAALGHRVYADGKLSVKCELDSYVFDKADMTDEEVPQGEFDCVVAVRPEQIQIFEEPGEGRIPVRVYANQPAGSETLVSLRAGSSDFLSKQIGLAHYDLDQTVYVSIAPEKINVYNAQTTRLIKRAR